MQQKGKETPKQQNKPEKQTPKTDQSKMTKQDKTKTPKQEQNKTPKQDKKVWDECNTFLYFLYFDFILLKQVFFSVTGGLGH